MRWLAFTMAAAAVGVLVAAGSIGLPRLLVWIVVIVLFWAAAVLWYWSVDRQRGAGRPAALRPGETYARAVPLRVVPNVPIAEALCSRLREAGIESFVKRVSATAVIGATTSDFGPAEIWVQEDRVTEANAVLGPE